jgi:glucokinase
VGRASGCAIGVDLGATKIASALIDASGEVRASRQDLTRAAEGVPAVLGRIAAQVEELRQAAAAEMPDAPLLGVGIGTPGRVDADAGTVEKAVNLGWEQVPLATEMKARLGGGLPIYLAKDANASALGEYYFGAGRGCPDFVYLGVGSGLGGGALTGGQLVTGGGWTAMEVGHISLDPDGLACACGLHGCAETLASGPGVVNAVRLLRAEQAWDSGLAAEATPRDILAAAAAGDPLARAALARSGSWLGIVMAACVTVLNPTRIVVGGGLGLAAFDYLVPAARAELARRTLRSAHQNLQIFPSRLVSSAVGAACLVWYAAQTEGKGGEARPARPLPQSRP